MPDFINIEQLTINLAKIQDLTTQQLISIVRDILNAAGTGYNIQDINGLYGQYYQELEKRLAQEGRDNPNSFSDLWEFYKYWTENGMNTYASRRAYVAGIYKTDVQKKQFEIWTLIHPEIVEIARSRFDNKHYADAVEASFKEINSRIKAIVHQITGKEYDGADLMNTAFSVKSPIIILDDIETDDGRNIQVGFMQIFSGSMTGIRNPKAHSNIILKPEEAIPMLFLASMLLSKLDKAHIKELPRDYSGLLIRVDKVEPGVLKKIKEIILKDQGECPVFLQILDSGKKKYIRTDYKVHLSAPVILSLKKIVGVDDVQLKQSKI